MRRRLAVAGGLLCAVLLVPSWAAAQGAAGTTQDKQDKKAAANELRVEGVIRNVDKDAHTFLVRMTGRVAERQVVYSDSTKFTFRNKAGSLEEVQDGRRVIVLGTPNEKKQIVARRIDIRDEQ